MMLRSRRAVLIVGRVHLHLTSRVAACHTWLLGGTWLLEERASHLSGGCMSQLGVEFYLPTGWHLS
jgi:hypothetical protein